MESFEPYVMNLIHPEGEQNTQCYPQQEDLLRYKLCKYTFAAQEAF